jgi:hypothetical protein
VLQGELHPPRHASDAACSVGAGTIATSRRLVEVSVGKFILGFVVAIVLVLFVVARCVGAIV